MEPIDTELFGVVHRKQKINSKVKGNSNELIVSKILTQWTGHEFVRVPMSGGLRWKNRVDICGDLINTDPTFEFIFSVETKAIANLGLHKDHPGNLRYNSKIYTYWSQCKRDADASNKKPFLMVRQNGMKTGSYYIFLSFQFDQQMKICNYIMPVFHSTTPQTLLGFDSEKFFKLVSYGTLKWIYNE